MQQRFAPETQLQHEARARKLFVHYKLAELRGADEIARNE